MIIHHLNQRSAHLATFARSRASLLGLKVTSVDRATVLDFGVNCEGGLEAGLLLAKMCLSSLAHVELAPASPQIPLVPQVFVRTDHPIAACLLSQYAGWKVSVGDYFAMGSGPMRAIARSEDLVKEFSESEDGKVAVGVLESGRLPNDEVIQSIRKHLPGSCSLTLAVAPTASQAGTIQVVARSIETALHKLHELRFPLNVIASATGAAPLPPVAKNDLQGIGRTNDAILYGATVNLWVRCEDDLIREVGPDVPSNSSSAHGQTFLTLFKAANHDFYAMDAALFSPAVVVFHNLKSGRSFTFGQLAPDLIIDSFGLN